MIDRITVVVPVGIFPELPKICAENIFANSCDYIDIAFLVTKNTNPDVINTIDDIKNVRKIQCPFDQGDDHCVLLDWVMYNGKVKDWVLVQHADVFWQENWLKPFTNVV
jgi:hypothetical protein